MAGWNFLSSMADIFKSQGVAILINLFLEHLLMQHRLLLNKLIML